MTNNTVTWVTRVPRDAKGRLRNEKTFYTLPGNRTRGIGLGGVRVPDTVWANRGVALPTANITPSNVDERPMTDDAEGNTAYPVRVTFGLRNLEVGGLYEFNNGEKVWGVNGKAGFNIASLPLAVGALYARGQDSGINALTVYLVHTHSFGKQLHASLGIDWTRVDFRPGTDSQVRGYLGADYTFANKLAITAEYHLKSSSLGESDPLASVGVRYPLTDAINVQAGFTNASPLGMLGTGSQRLFAGVDFGFGGTGKSDGHGGY